MAAPAPEPVARTARAAATPLVPSPGTLAVVLVLLALLAGVGLVTAEPVPPNSAGSIRLQVPSVAMAPTIRIGQMITIRRYADPSLARPRVGQIVVAHPPRGADPDGSGFGRTTTGDPICGVREAARAQRPCPRPAGGPWRDERFALRIVAGPGDTIAFRGGRVVRNGRPAREPFADRSTCDASAVCDLPRPVRVPADHYVLAGDDRGQSNDSRSWGPIHRSWLVGLVTTIEDRRRWIWEPEPEMLVIR